MIYNYVQEDINLEKLLQFVQENKPDYINIVSDTEWSYNPSLKHLLLDISNLTKINFLFGSFECDWYKINYPYANVHHWNTFWFNWGELCLSHVYDYKNVNYSNFTHPFICLNNKSNILRCSIVDNLARLNYLDKGNITWNKFKIDTEGFVFKYYDDSFRSLDDDFFNKQDSFIICKEFFTSLFHIVGESTNHVPFITEKTVIPILLKKPFVTLGCKNFNRKLKDLGFELYDELIDYSFDDQDDVRLRGQILTDSLNELINCNNLLGLYNKLLPKIEHNYNRALQIIKTRNYIPQLVQDRINHLYESKLTRSPVEGRWEHFITHSH